MRYHYFGVDHRFSRSHQIMRRILCVTSLLLVWFCFNPEQLLQAGEPVPEDARFGFEIISADNMKAILNFLAADELEGRATAHRGLKIAAKFLESQYKLAGLTPVPGHDSMLQKFFILESSIDTTSSLSVGLNSSGAQISYKFSLYHDFWMPSYGSASYTIQAPVVFAGYGLKDESTGYNDFKGIQAKGKILMVFTDKPEFMVSEEQTKMPYHRRMRELSKKKMQTAKDLGAVAILTISKKAIPAQVNRFKKWLKRHNFTLMGGPQPLPQFIISEELADAILSGSAWSAKKLRENIATTAKPNSFPVKDASVILDVKIHTQLKETQNVVAYLEGSDPEVNHEVIALGAHYDHLGKDENGKIFNGADDDGSGTTGMLEIARAFAKNPIRPRRSLLFISHTGEERGMLGSDYYTDNPLLPLKNTVALLNMDMIGRNAENSVYIIGSDFLSKELHQLNEAANTSVGLELDYKYNSKSDPNRFYYRSDHYSYAKHGIPLVFYFAGIHEDYHKATDTVDKIDFKKMEKIARLVYLTAWTVANLDHRLNIDGTTNSKVD